MGDDLKTVVIDGVEWTEMGPYCQLCGAHMGELYNAEAKPTVMNPNNYDSYDDNKCPKCGQKYEYEEGDMLVLTEEQLDLLRKHAGI